MTAPKRKYQSNELKEARKIAKQFNWGLWKFSKAKTPLKDAEKGYYVGPQLPAAMNKPSITVTELSV